MHNAFIFVDHSVMPSYIVMIKVHLEPGILSNPPHLFLQEVGLIQIIYFENIQ
jgi:hypothetical protein